MNARPSPTAPELAATNFSPTNPTDLATCLPDLPDIDWSLLARTPFVFVGTGAIGRPLAVALAWLGMRRAALVDRKRYKPQSMISQCEPGEIGCEKAVVVAERLAELGVAATPWPCDVEELPHGVVEPGAVVVAALDNRLADIEANRLAGRMQARLVKVNVEPGCLTASLRFYDFRSHPAAVCAECQMSARHYSEERHPQGCDGGGPQRSTGSPRPLCHLAANAAALAIAQFVCSPGRWSSVWKERQWQQSLLGGAGTVSQLSPNPNCRWNHAEHWENLVRLPGDTAEIRLCDLLAAAGAVSAAATRIRFSARVATAGRCRACQARRANLLSWVARLDRPIGGCPCGGPLLPEPFSTRHSLPANHLNAVLNVPLAEWGVPGLSVLSIETARGKHSFVTGSK